MMSGLGMAELSGRLLSILEFVGQAEPVAGRAGGGLAFQLQPRGDLHLHTDAGLAALRPLPDTEEDTRRDITPGFHRRPGLAARLGAAGAGLLAAGAHP